MASAGTMFEAQSAMSLAGAVVGTLNSIDDLGQNNKGEGLLEQNIENPEAKNVIEKVKTGVSAASSVQSTTNLRETAKSPFKVASLWNDI